VSRQSFLGVLLVGVLAGCTSWVQIDLKPSDCINPKSGHCMAANDSRVLLVRLYQLKEAVDPCKLDLAELETKDLDTLKSKLANTQRIDEVRWELKVEPKDPKALPRWQLLKESEYILAVAFGYGRGKNTVRLIPIDRAKGADEFPTLHFHNYDICLDQPCQVSPQEQCQ
jgi:hypothetical protein